MEGQSYKTFTSEFKWISKWEKWHPSVRINRQFWFFAHLNDHRRSLFCNGINILWWVNFFLSLFITFRTNFRMSIISSPCLFLFCSPFRMVPYLSTDKKSNAICIFANLCSTLFSRWFKFLHLGSTSCRNAQKRGKKLTGKHLNVDRQFLKDVMRIFWCYCV